MSKLWVALLALVLLAGAPPASELPGTATFPARPRAGAVVWLGPGALVRRSGLFLSCAMCGFANFGSVGIMIGGLGTMAPQGRDEINALGLKSIVSGTLATCLMGAIVGVLS
mgnify:CR=1 FL=1